jgi:hypothetical protein
MAQCRGAHRPEPGERPRGEDRDVAAGVGAVKHAGAGQQVPAGAGRHELADGADRPGQELRRRADRGERVPTRIIVSAPSAVPASPSTVCSAATTAEIARTVRLRPAALATLAIDDAQPALHDRGGGQPG